MTEERTSDCLRSVVSSLVVVKIQSVIVTAKFRNYIWKRVFNTIVATRCNFMTSIPPPLSHHIYTS